MVTREGFDRYIAEKAREGIPFSAYWYQYGYGLLITGKIRREGYSTWKSRATDGKEYEYSTYDLALRESKGGKAPKEIRHPAREYGPTKGTISRWYKAVDRLRKRYAWNFVTVEFDGKSTTYEEVGNAWQS